MKKIAIFPGSFDPFSKGHQHIVEKALPLFDKIVIGVGKNTQKKHSSSAQERNASISEIYKDNPQIEVKIFDGLTVDFAREEKASYIIRGLRSQEDFIYEQQVAEANKTLIGIETIFFCSDADKKEISSSLLRELKSFGKDILDYLPELY